MPISVTAFATPVAELIEILPNVAGVISLAKNTADDLNFNVKPQTNKIPGIDTAARSAASKADEALASGFDAIQRADRAIDEAGDAILTSNLALDDAGRAIQRADDALGKAGSALGQAADLFDRVANIFNLIATLGSIIRMEQIAANSRQRDADLQTAIDQLRADLEEALMGLSEQLNSIKNDTSSIRIQTNLIDDIYARMGLITSIYNAVQLIDSIYDRTGLIYDRTGTIINFVDDIPALQSSVNSVVPALQSSINSIIPAIPSKVCEALNSGCFDWESIGSDCDLSPVITRLNSLQQTANSIDSAVGSGSGSCGEDSFAFGSLTHGLEILVCGGNGFNFNEALEDYFANNQAVDLQPVIDKVESKGEEVIAAIEEIEVVAAIPDQWQVRVGADRPQLIVSYAETLTGGKIGRSRFPLTIPHWNGLKRWDLLPKWTKGNIQARLILKDNSRVYIYAASESTARDAMNKVIKFIDPNMIGNKTPFVGKANIEIKSRKVEPCTAKFYAKGQKTEIPDHYQIRAKNGKL